MELFILETVTKYPVLSGVLAGLYILSAINKPLFTLLHAYVDATETIKDNEILSAIEGSKAYAVVKYILDWAVRVKLPTAEK